MLIRVESLADIIAIEKLYHSLGEAFIQQSDEIVRSREDGRITLSLVACNDVGEVIGHAMFAPVAINGEDRNWQYLAALVTQSTDDRTSVERALVQSGIDSLAEFGYPVCLASGIYDAVQQDGAFYVEPKLQFVHHAGPVFVCEFTSQEPGSVCGTVESI